MIACKTRINRSPLPANLSKRLTAKLIRQPVCTHHPTYRGAEFTFENVVSRAEHHHVSVIVAES